MLIFIFCVCFSHFYNKKSIGNYYLKMLKNYGYFFLIPIYKIKLHPHWWSIIYLSQKWTLDFWAVKWTYLWMRLYYNATNFKSNIFPFRYIVYLFLMKKKKNSFVQNLPHDTNLYIWQAGWHPLCKSTEYRLLLLFGPNLIGRLV